MQEPLQSGRAFSLRNTPRPLSAGRDTQNRGLNVVFRSFLIHFPDSPDIVTVALR